MERMTIPCGPGCLEVDAQWRQALCSSGSLSSQVRGLRGLVYPKCPCGCLWVPGV